MCEFSQGLTNDFKWFEQIRTFQENIWYEMYVIKDNWTWNWKKVTIKLFMARPISPNFVNSPKHPPRDCKGRHQANDPTGKGEYKREN